MRQVLDDDGLVKLDLDGLTIQRYYFPTGTSKETIPERGQAERLIE